MPEAEVRLPYKVIVWGPGGLGMLCIREIVLNAAFSLVGVRVYSESKHGVDAGVLAGIGPLGVPASSDVNELLALSCDCILYTARDFGNYDSDAEIIQLLEAGRNLVTTLPYQHLEIARSAGFAQRIEDACRLGGSRFHATGVNPSLIPDRVLLALTGLCNEVRGVKSEEFWDVSNLQPETLQILGFGVPVDGAEPNASLSNLADNFLKQGLMATAEALGASLDRIEVEADQCGSEHDVHIRGGRISRGMVGRITRRWCGYLDAIGSAPFVTMEMNWVIGRSQLPVKFAGASGYHGWLLTVDGRPSVTSLVDLQSTLHAKDAGPLPDDAASEAGYMAVVATMLQAVPHVCAEPAGIVHTQRAPIHWRKDFRAF